MNDQTNPERDHLTGMIIGSAIEVHKHLGPGLLESVYQKCLCHEMQLRHIEFARQVELPIIYKQLHVERSLVIDIVVANEIIVELKSVEAIHKVHEAQVLTYMKLSGKKTGLILNFNVPVLKNGIKRFLL